MGRINLCRDCKYYTPNGRVIPNDGIFPLPDMKLGDCTCPVEPPYTRLKNEHNGCENWKEKGAKFNHELQLYVSIKDDSIHTIVSEPESGLVKKFVDPISVDEHPEYNERIGNEIYSWISLWLDEADELN